jgi:integrase
MARLVDQLTESKIRALTAVGLHADGRGLYLQVRTNARSWIYRFTLNGRTRDMGLGPLAVISLVRARTKAAAARALVTEGIDPIEYAKAQEAAPAALPAVAPLTFEEAAEAYMADRLKRLRSVTHRHQWRQTLEDFAFPIIGKKPVAEIETNDVLAVLKPIWETKCETAQRLRGRIERILARASVEGHRTGANPATWRGHLQEALPSRAEVQPIVHFRAMEFAEVPAFMSELCRRDEVGAIALRFLILTVARTGEVLGARWSEVDLNEKTWTVPAERAKTGRDHIVPLSTGALAALNEVKELRDLSDEIIFPGRKGKGLSTMALLALLQRRMKRAVTVHGYRSAFRDWAGDEGDVPRELAEASLAHVVKDVTERAYRRKTAVERRRQVMQAWCDYCLTPSNAHVIDMQKARQLRESDVQENRSQRALP